MLCSLKHQGTVFHQRSVYKNTVLSCPVRPEIHRTGRPVCSNWDRCSDHWRHYCQHVIPTSHQTVAPWQLERYATQGLETGRDKRDNNYCRREEHVVAGRAWIHGSTSSEPIRIERSATKENVWRVQTLLIWFVKPIGMVILRCWSLGADP